MTERKGRSNMSRSVCTSEEESKNGVEVKSMFSDILERFKGIKGDFEKFKRGDQPRHLISQKRTSQVG